MLHNLMSVGKFEDCIQEHAVNTATTYHYEKAERKTNTELGIGADETISEQKKTPE